MDWVACYESTSDVNARTVRELLERRGIPCVLQPSSSAPSAQAVLVRADRATDARAFIEEVMPWAVPVPPPASTPPPDAAPRRRVLRPLALVRGTVRFVAEHPSVLLLALPTLVQAAFGSSEDRSWSWNPAALRDHTVTYLVTFLAGQLPSLLAYAATVAMTALTVAFTDRALDGPTSWSDAARAAVPRFPWLLGYEAATSAVLLVAAFLMLVGPGLVRLALIPGLIYAGIRLVFVPVVLVVERIDFLDAMARSWAFVGVEWPALLGLGLLDVIASWASSFLGPVAFVVDAVLDVMMTVVMVLAYRALSPAALPAAR